MIDKLITRIVTVSELKQVFNEIVFNVTDKVSKISKTSVLNAVNYAISKIAQKSMKDVAVIESQIFPELASGQYLDNAAQLWYGEVRQTSTQSSTFVRVNASVGTIYSPGAQKFVSDSGVEFNIVEELIVGNSGFGYVNVRSVPAGEITNVDPFTMNTINPKPIGHVSCTNEYKAIGGREFETDTDFRNRITSAKGISSRDTLNFITEMLRLQDSNILKVIKAGINDDYEVKLAIVRCNGSYYTNAELVELQENLYPYLSISDSLGIFGSGIKLMNVEWFYVGGANGIDFRADILTSFDTDTVRKDIQVSLAKFLDFANSTQKKILWDDLLEVIKNVEGVKYVPTEHFNPKTDQYIPVNQLPRIKGFKMRDLSGNIIFDAANKIQPIFYQNI